MTNQALIYQSPSKRPIAAALTAAALIHLSAVAIAFHRETLSVPMITTDFPPMEGEPAEDSPTPPDPDIEVPTSPPVPQPSSLSPNKSDIQQQTGNRPRPFDVQGKLGSPSWQMRKHSRSVPRDPIIRTKRAAATSPEAVSPSLAWIPSPASPPT